MTKIKIWLLLLTLASPAYAGVGRAQTVEDTVMVAGTTHTITLSAAVANNLIIVGFGFSGNTGAFTAPSGFTALFNYTNQSGAIDAWWGYKISTGGETAITATTVQAIRSSMVAIEYTGLLSSGVFDDTASTNSHAVTVSSLSSGTTVTTAQERELAVAFFTVDNGNNFQSRSYTNSFTERISITSGAGTSTGSVLADKTLSAVGTAETTASWQTADESIGSIATFKIANRGIIIVR